MRRTTPLPVAALAGAFAGALALCGACGSPPAGDLPTNIQPQTAVGQGPAGVGSELAELRRVTARFHDFEAARDAGWSAQITGCMSNPGVGAMGFHYGNPAYIDGAVAVDQPELLLYEPEKNGRMRLVGIEYIVPLAAWTSPQPPRLFGRDFAVNAAFGIWALHAWVWNENPSGIFADWNPKVTCAFASSTSTMSHD